MNTDFHSFLFFDPCLSVLVAPQNSVIASLPLPQRELVRAPSPQAERGLTACLLPSFSACGERGAGGNRG